MDRLQGLDREMESSFPTMRPAARSPAGLPPDLLKGRFAETELRQLEARVNELPIVKHCNMAASISTDGIVEARLLAIEHYHLGGMETHAINGGIILGLLDCALVVPGILHFGSERCATIELSVKIMRPVIAKDVRSVGYAVSKTKHLAFTRAAVFDLRNQVRAMATGVVTKL